MRLTLFTSIFDNSEDVKIINGNPIKYILHTSLKDDLKTIQEKKLPI